MEKTLRWGVLGAAKFAREHMAPAIHAAAHNTLSAIATSSAEKAAPFQAINPHIEVFTDYDAMLASDTIDAVYIPLPNHLHVEWAKRANAADKHVLCEKPIAMAASQIDELIALRSASGLHLAEAYMIVHHPQWQKAREIVQSGMLGELVQVDAVFSYNNVADTENIRNDPGKGGGGLPDIGVYTCGSARYVTGEEPEEIISSDIKFENGVDVWAGVSARFPGFRFFSVTSMRAAPRQHLTFHGEKGYLSLKAPFNPSVFDQAELLVRMADGTETRHIFPRVNHYVNQVEAFRDTAFNGTDYPCPLEFSQGTQRMLDMIFAKAKA